LRIRGDEAELYLEYNADFVGHVYRSVSGHIEDIKDACAFAWSSSCATSPTATATGRAGCSARHGTRPGV
jgi:hypothetical protein